MPETLIELPMKTPEELIQKGFNDGYLLAKYQPELAAKLARQAHEQSPYFTGLVSGKAEYEAEVNAWAKSFHRGTPERDSKDMDKER